MRTVSVGVASLDQVKARASAALRGERQGEFVSFATVELLWKTLTPRRWALLRALSGQAPMSLRASARLAGHDVKTVHGDVQALLATDILEKDDQGRIFFPYDALHVDFTITKLSEAKERSVA